MTFEKQHLRHCFFFSHFNLKKSRMRQKKWFIQLWVKTLHRTCKSTCKKWFQQFWERNFNLQNSERNCCAFSGIRRAPLWDAATWSDRHFWVLLTTIDPYEWRMWRKKTVYWQWEKVSDNAQSHKKDSGNHRRLRLENSSSCGVFSRLGPFWLTSISIPTIPS